MKYIKKILDNGMCIVMVPIEHSQLITIGFFISAGSRNETDRNSGIAHFLEHMMFKGTFNRNTDKLFNELDMLGAIYNAVTTAQMTYYYISGNYLDTKHLLDIILDIYINPKFTTKEIIKEKKVVIEEMRMRLDTPLMKLYSKMHKKIFKGTSLERNIIGNMDTINNFKKKELIKFRQSLYKPENTVFVIVGNFSPMPIFRIIKKILGPLENSQIPIITYYTESDIILKNMKDQKKPYVYIKKDTSYNQAYFLLVFPMYDLYNYKYREIMLLSQLLTSGFSSRLTRALRENKGITYTITSYPIVYRDSGLFVIQMIVIPDKLTNAIKIIFSELRKLKKNIVSPIEFKKVINISKTDMLFSLSHQLDIFVYLGINLLSNRDFILDIRKELSKTKKIKRKQILIIANKIFVWEKINLFIYGNVNSENIKLTTL
jgi:predicted Zn-dependent peptidase